MSTLNIPLAIAPLFPSFNVKTGDPKAESADRQPLVVHDTNIMATRLGPTDIGANWLPDIERRVLASAFDGDGEYVNDGSTLPRDVIDTALAFFQAASDLLPTRPYVYSSLKGDLVAEFRTGDTNVVTIVRSDSVTAYGAHLSTPVRFQYVRGEPLAMRKSALKFYEQIPMREDADLDSRPK